MTAQSTVQLRECKRLGGCPCTQEIAQLLHLDDGACTSHFLAAR